MSKEPEIILIVDDDEDILELEKVYCQKLGFEVRSAENTQQARDWLGKNVPSAMVLDIMMPDEHGLDLCEWVRSQERLAKVPVLIVSALIGEEIIQDSLERGAADFLSKPFSETHFIEKLKRTLSKKQ